MVVKRRSVVIRELRGKNLYEVEMLSPDVALALALALALSLSRPA
jgi:hypothetical protein